MTMRNNVLKLTEEDMEEIAGIIEVSSSMPTQWKGNGVVWENANPLGIAKEQYRIFETWGMSCNGNK